MLNIHMKSWKFWTSEEGLKKMLISSGAHTLKFHAVFLPQGPQFHIPW